MLLRHRVEVGLHRPTLDTLWGHDLDESRAGECGEVRVRYVALLALEGIGQEAEEAVPALIYVLKDREEDLTIRNEAIVTL